MQSKGGPPVKKWNLVLSLAAGLFGGFLSHYAWSTSVRADGSPSTVNEVRAQSFVLVDAKGMVQGVFRADTSSRGPASIQLFDAQGREIWRAGNNGLQLIVGSTNRR